MIVSRRRVLRKIVYGFHGLLYRLTGGLIWDPYAMPVLILTTIGRKTGKKRHTPLTYVTDGHNLILAASNAGKDWNPDWCLNLRGNPQATVQVKRRKMAVVAEVADPQDRDRLWPRFVSLNPVYDQYQKRTQREIPIIVLRPIDKARG